MSEPYNLLSGVPTGSDLCKTKYYCVHSTNLIDLVYQPFDEWPKCLGRCLICCHFLRPDFANTPS